jgi:uncharacterized protein DUF6766
MSTGQWIRDRSLGLVFLGLFLASWIGQLVVEWFEFVNDQHTHGESAEFWSGDFWFTFGQSTLENWQSEFLQVASFVIATAYFVYKGSAESGDSDQRVEAKLDALLRRQGMDPEEIERRLPEMHQRTPKEREEHRRASVEE